MQILGGYTRCIMVYVKMVNGKLQKWSFILSFFLFFFEDVPLRTFHVLGNPNPNPVLNLRLLV